MGSITNGKTVPYRATAVIYVITMAITFYSDTALPKAASAVIIPIAVFAFLLQPDIDRLKKAVGFPLLIIGGISLVLAWSALLWIINFANAAFVISGITRLLYHYINITVVLCAVYMFGSRAVDYTLYSAFAANGAHVIVGLLRHGVSPSLGAVAEAIKSGSQTGFMADLELHDLTYVFGFFIVYYLLVSDVGAKRKALAISGCLLFILLGFKRIIFLSALIGVVLTLLCKALPKPKRKPFAFTVGIITATAAFLFVPFVRYGGFERMTEYFGIETSGRTGIYEYFTSLYDFKPTFSGYGIGYVNKYFEYLKSVGAEFEGSSVSYLHSDILCRFIELGFVGFCFWLLGNCVVAVRWLYKHCGALTCALYAIINAVHFIDFSVGNTCNSYIVRIAFFAVTAGTAAGAARQDGIDRGGNQ